MIMRAFLSLHMENNSTWKRDILLIPLIIGIILVVAAFALPKFFDRGKRLSYTIDGPTAFVNTNTAGMVKIAVNGVETTNIFGYKVCLWNSGSVPLTAIPVRFVFEVTNTNFHVFNVSHTTTPRREFGKIDENGSDASSKRFVYELLNPSDADVLTFVTDVDVPLSVFAKAEGLKIKSVQVSALVSALASKKLSDFLGVTLLVVCVVSSVITVLSVIARSKPERQSR